MSHQKMMQLFREGYLLDWSEHSHKTRAETYLVQENFALEASEGLMQCSIKGWGFLANSKHLGAADLIDERIMEVMPEDLFLPSKAKNK